MTSVPERSPLGVVLIDDSILFRQGLAALLTAAGVRVLAELGDADALDAVLATVRPHLVVLDVRMPPTHTDEGIATALRLRADHPEVGTLVLSTYTEGTWARRLLADGGHGVGYLLKDRVGEVGTLVDALHRVAAGGTVVDPEVVASLLQLTSRRSALEPLTAREREVLSLMAEGRSNVGIGRRLFLSPRTVEAHIAAIFAKLPLDHDDNTLNRRVLAVLTFLQDRATG